jgi:hypothetical protein
MTSSEITPGTRLRSQVCVTEVIVVRAGEGTVELTCGGARMIALGEQPDGMELASSLAAGSQIGKRYYAVADESFEVLVTKGGEGTLADGSEPLLVRQAKPLPASD